MEYLLYDEETHVVLIYLEDIKSGKDFLEVAKKVSLKKPVVVIKSGKSEAGARAAASHTGAIAGADKIYDAAFEKTGVIRAKNMDEFFDIGKALATMKPGVGTNIGILTDAGGPGVMCVDECEILGLTVNKFGESTLKKFEELKENGSILKIAATYNPVDLTGSVTDDQFIISADLMFQGTLNLRHYFPWTSPHARLTRKIHHRRCRSSSQIQQANRCMRHRRNRNGALHKKPL